MTFATRKRDHGAAIPSWWAGNPATRVAISAVTYIGGRFTFDVAGRVFGFRAYLESSDILDHWAIFWNFAIPEIERAVSFFPIAQGAAGWRNVWLCRTYRIVPNTDYMLAVPMTVAFYRTNAATAAHPTVNHIQYYSSFQTTSIDPITASRTENTNANGIDILFKPD